MTISSESLDSISEALGQHYAEQFSRYGPTSAGVDWGPDESRMFLRYEQMFKIANDHGLAKASLLDVGCGFGGLQRYAMSKNISLDYTGVDLAKNMIDWATLNVAPGTFLHGDLLRHQFDGQFDYVVCNGILTQKLAIPAVQMDQFAGQLIRKMFSLCRIGTAFNVMTSKVNYRAANLYYRDPGEMVSW
jgi:2-polyprenyl-3-methyl-5-hydroxy-6-metoxy-1,4-benzoquinol methylase